MAAKQGFGQAFSAEMRRVVLKPRRLVMASVFAIAGILLFAGMTAALDWGSSAAASGELEGVEPFEAIPAFIGFDIPLSLVSFCFGVYAAAFSARDYNDGTIMATLLLVPGRARLFLGRMLPWVLLTAVFSLVAFAVIAAIGMGTAGAGEAPAIALQGILATVASVFTAIVGFCCGTVTKKGSLSVFLFLALFFLIPSVVGMAAGFGPDVMQAVVKGVNSALPGNVFPALLSIASPDKATSDTWIALGVSVAWAVGAPAVSYALFKARATLGR